MNNKNRENRVYLCLDIMIHLVANNIVDDVLIGCNFGDITGLIDGKIIVLKESAHESALNCIKIMKLPKDVKNHY